ncbi:MAG: serine hydrolase [Saprospiraceae bacterium]
MKKRTLSFAFFCWLFYQPLVHAQIFNDSFPGNILKEFVLLKNSENLLPFQNLESNRIGVVEMDTTLSEFSKTLKRYSNVKSISWPDLSIEGLDVLIFHVHGKNTQTDVFNNYLHLIHSLTEEKPKLVMVWEGTDLSKLDPDPLDALLFLPKSDNLNESLAAQVLFGAFGVNGALQEDKGNFKKGEGIAFPSNGRLRFVPPSWMGVNEDSLFKKVGQIVEEGISKQAFPGATILAAKSGNVFLLKSWGHHTYDTLRKVKETDIYDYASITKVSASIPAIMKLTESGLIHLNDKLYQLYPDFWWSNKRGMTLQRMLTHSAGLQAWIPFWKETIDENGVFKYHTFSKDSSEHYPLKVADSLFLHKNYREKIFKAIKKSPVTKEGAYVYSDLSYYLYPEIVEEKTGISFESFLKNTFYRPLGAFSLTYNAYQNFPASEIIPTENDTFFRHALLHGRVHDEGAAMLDGISGHAGLFGNVVDLAKLFQMYLNGGSYGDRQFLQDSTIQRFTSAPYKSEGNRRGIGFDKPLLEYHPQNSSSAKAASPETFGHSGYTGTLVWADPENEVLFIFLSNRVYPSRENRKIYTENIRPRIQTEIYNLLGIKAE